MTFKPVFASGGCPFEFAFSAPTHTREVGAWLLKLLLLCGRLLSSLALSLLLPPAAICRILLCSGETTKRFGGHCCFRDRLCTHCDIGSKRHDRCVAHNRPHRYTAHRTSPTSSYMSSTSSVKSSRNLRYLLPGCDDISHLALTYSPFVTTSCPCQDLGHSAHNDLHLLMEVIRDSLALDVRRSSRVPLISFTALFNAWICANERRSSLAHEVVSSYWNVR